MPSAKILKKNYTLQTISYTLQTISYTLQTISYTYDFFVKNNFFIINGLQGLFLTPYKDKDKDKDIVSWSRERVKKHIIKNINYFDITKKM